MVVLQVFGYKSRYWKIKKEKSFIVLKYLNLVLKKAACWVFGTSPFKYPTLQLSMCFILDSAPAVGLFLEVLADILSDLTKAQSGQPHEFSAWLLCFFSLWFMWITLNLTSADLKLPWSWNVASKHNCSVSTVNCCNDFTQLGQICSAASRRKNLQ